MGRTFILLLIAGLVGLGAAWIAYKRVNVPTAAAAPDTAMVAVAAFDLPYGTPVEAAQIKLVPWPRGSVPEGAFSTAEAVVGKLTNAPIGKDEPLTDRRVVENLGGSALANLIDPTKRAMTVRVNDVIGVGGFLLPGNRVDVIATREVGTGNDRRAESKTVLENLKVLAVDQTARTEDDKPVVVRAVTVEVDPREAETLTKATVEGTVQLVLRNPLDTDVAEVVEPPKPAPVRRVVARPAAPTTDPNLAPVTVIRGTAADTTKAQKQ